MLELSILNSVKGAAQKGNGNGGKGDDGVAYAISLVLIVLLLVWAFWRALKCSSATPDSRALHLMFASVSPVLYLIFSYTVSGFCE